MLAFQNSLNLLHMTETARVITDSKSLRAYVANHLNLKGQPVVTCKATVRQLKWKNVGAGMYEVWSEE